MNTQLVKVKDSQPLGSLQVAMQSTKKKWSQFKKNLTRQFTSEVAQAVTMTRDLKMKVTLLSQKMLRYWTQWGQLTGKFIVIRNLKEKKSMKDKFKTKRKKKKSRIQSKKTPASMTGFLKRKKKICSLILIKFQLVCQKTSTFLQIESHRNCLTFLLKTIKMTKCMWSAKMPKRLMKKILRTSFPIHWINQLS